MLSLLFFLTVTTARADAFPFHHDVLCRQSRSGGEQQSVKIVYDKTQHQDFGRIGEILVELNTGVGELANIANAIGTDKPYQRILRTEGAAGQVGNLLLQDEKDPFIVSAVVGFSKMDLVGADGKTEKSLANFLTSVKLSRVQERGYFDSDQRLETRDIVLLEISGGLSGFGRYFVRFDAGDCKTLN